MIRLGLIALTLLAALQGRAAELLTITETSRAAAEPPAEEADRLVAKLKDRGETDVTLIGHSMGGLVSYDLLTRPAFVDESGARPRVDRLITLGTPFGGSPWAPLRGRLGGRSRPGIGLRSESAKR